MGVLRLAGRRRLRLFARRDVYGRFYSCLVYLPRDRYNTENRGEDPGDPARALCTAWTSTTTRASPNRCSPASTSWSASTPTRSTTRSTSTRSRPNSSTRPAPGTTTSACSSTTMWAKAGADPRQGLRARLPARVQVRAHADQRREGHRETRDAPRAGRHGTPVVPPRRRRHRRALQGLLLRPGRRALRGAAGAAQPRRPGLRGAPVPHQTRRRNDPPARLRSRTAGRARRIVVAAAHPLRERVPRRLGRRGRIGPVQRAGARRRAHLAPGRRAPRLAKYLRQSGFVFSQAYIESTLRRYPEIAANLVRLFEARFDPRVGADRARRRRPHRRDPRRGLADVPSLDAGPDPARVPHADPRHPAHLLLPAGAGGRARRIRGVQARPAGHRRTCPSRARCSRSSCTRPRFEGVHLRFGAVARGGLRWSDRREDFRTEVLGLVKAQMVKNTVIVPVGRQGRLRAQAAPAGRTAKRTRPRASPATGRSSAALLDITDNLVGGKTVAAGRAWSATTATTPTWSWRPTRARPRSPTSPTPSPPSTASGSATRSPPAARPATTTRRWASPPGAPGNRSSGTSASSGVDTQTQDFTVRRHRRHVRRRVRQRHAAVASTSGWWPRSTTGTSSSTRIPTPPRRFAERERLFDLPRSSWADYDTTLISAGGGVCPRTREVDPGHRRGARGARHRRRRRGADAARADARDPRRAGGPALERRHRHLRQGHARDPRRRRRPGQRRDPRQRRRSCAARWSARAATSAAPSSAASSTRSPAAGSTPTSSTTRPAWTPPTTR